MGPHTQEVEHDARVAEQAIRDAFAAHVNPALTRLAQEILKARAEIPKYVREAVTAGDFSLTTTNGVTGSLEIPADTNSLERITDVLVVAQAAQAFSVVLQLGSFALPIPAVAAAGGQFSAVLAAPVNLLLRANERRRVTLSAGVTAISVVLMGEELPTTRY